MKLKKTLIMLTFILINTAFNVGVYLYSYKKLTFPFLHEEQRMENAPYIFLYIIPSFFLISIFTIIVFNYINKK
jgi:hypothetical protein